VALERTTADGSAEGPLVGYSVIWVVMDEAELANLAVAPHRRRAGIGRILLESALSDAEAGGARVVYLEVRASNTAALKLYEAHGFLPVGRRSAYYRNPSEDALVLRARIGRNEPAADC
jgi:ribosomal-protein-alanine N-acetyltransferase